MEFVDPTRLQSREAQGGHLSGAGMNVTFLSLSESKISAMHYVVLNKIYSSCMICRRLFMAVCHNYSSASQSMTDSHKISFRLDQISQEGRVFPNFFLNGGFLKKLM